MCECDSNSVQFVRIYNQAPLKQLCAGFLKQHYISNVHRTLDKYFATECTDSEMSYLTGKSKVKLLPAMLYALSMSSSTFMPFSSDIIGKYDSSVLIGGVHGIPPPPRIVRSFFWCMDFPTHIIIHNYCNSYVALNHIIMKFIEEYEYEHE